MGASFSDSPLSLLCLGSEFETAVLWRNCVDTVSVLDIVRFASTSTQARNWCQKQTAASNQEDMRSLLRAMAPRRTKTDMIFHRLHWMAPMPSVRHSGEIYEPQLHFEPSFESITEGEHFLEVYPGHRPDFATRYRAYFSRGIRFPLIEDAVRVALKRPPPTTAVDGEPDPKKPRTN